MEWTLIGLIILALAFDFLNGFHDSANSISTVVSTRVLSPKFAVLWAAFFNFIAFIFFEHHVANTIGKGIIDATIVDQQLIFATLIAACLWDLITWYFGLPTSSSHALMGGMIGAALAKVGTSALVSHGIIKVVAFIFISPMIGLFLGIFIGNIVYLTFSKFSPSQVDKFFRKGQLFSAALYSLGHGGNDAQKTMGIISVLLFSTGQLGSNFYVPTWVMLSCQGAMAIGTLFGGWRIVKTMGSKITKLRPIDGFCAESSASISLFFASGMGIPVSTTQTITGAIMGVGSLKGMSAVRWGVAGQIIWAWILTIPAAAGVAMLAYQVVK